MIIVDTMLPSGEHVQIKKQGGSVHVLHTRPGYRTVQLNIAEDDYEDFARWVAQAQIKLQERTNAGNTIDPNTTRA